jgi:hypothetical protein
MHVLTEIFSLYRDGFMQMRVGKQLWLIIFIKLFILFAIVKVFFFPNVLDMKFATQEQKSTYILNVLTSDK